MMTNRHKDGETFSLQHSGRISIMCQNNKAYSCNSAARLRHLKTDCSLFNVMRSQTESKIRLTQQS